MLRMTLCLMSLATLACGLPAQPKPPVPKEALLSPGTAKVEGDKLLCELTTLEYRSETRAVTVVKDGKAVTENRTVNVPVYVPERRYIALKGLQAYVTADKGTDPTKRLKSLDSTKLTQLLKDNTRVFFFSGADKLDAEKVKDLKEGNVILVVPREKPAPRPPEKK